jgi:hypothetical protein
VSEPDCLVAVHKDHTESHRLLTRSKFTDRALQGSQKTRHPSLLRSLAGGRTSGARLGSTLDAGGAVPEQSGDGMHEKVIRVPCKPRSWRDFRTRTRIALTSISDIASFPAVQRLLEGSLLNRPQRERLFRFQSGISVVKTIKRPLRQPSVNSFISQNLKAWRLVWNDR